MTDPPEEKESLWHLTAAPAIWAVYFLLCYATATIWCEKVATPDGSLGTARAAIAVYTAVALAGIGLTGWLGFQRRSFGGSTAPHDFDTAQDRHRFLGFATLLLSALSAIATLYVALAAFFVDRCL